MGQVARGTTRGRHVSVRHGMARHEHISVGHEARHGTHVGRAGPKILGTRALKHSTIRDEPKHGTQKNT